MPSNQDLETPFDPTAYPSISGAQLEQFVNGTSPYTDKGLFILTTDVGINPTVPNATTTPKWQTYGWIRVSATLVTLYLWNPTGAVDATFLQWQSLNIIGIGAGSIVNSMIADNTIQSVKIVSLDYAKLTGVPANLPPSGPAGGALTGNYPNPSIANETITAAMIVDGTITSLEVAPQGLNITNIAGDGTAKDMIRSKVGTPAQLEFFTPPSIFTSGVVVTTTNNLIPIVTAAGVGDTGTWGMETPAVITLAGATDATTKFKSAQVGIAVGQAINVAHELGTIPDWVRAVLVCTTNDAANGYAVGDVIDITSIGFNTPEQHAITSWGANATNVFFTFDNGSGSNANGGVIFKVKNKATGAEGTLTNADWKLQMIAGLI